MLDKLDNKRYETFTKPYGARVYTVKRMILERIKLPFIKAVQKYMDEHHLNQGEVAEQTGLNRTRVNELLNDHRRLSAYYVFLFIRAGIVKMDQIYDGRSESAKESEFWATMSEAENLNLLHRIARIRKRGIDLDAVLDAIDPPKNKK